MSLLIETEIETICYQNFYVISDPKWGIGYDCP